MGDAGVTGVDNWTELAWAEQDYYLQPSTVHYLTHQIIMFFTCVWACVYLFKPLIRHHKYGPVGRSIDSDAMAVAVWYMSTLLSLTFVSRPTKSMHALFFSKMSLKDQDMQGVNTFLFLYI
jgi:hypothetical protein